MLLQRSVVIFTLADGIHEVGTREGKFQSAQFKQHTAQGPDIHLLVVELPSHDLWSHVDRSPAVGLRHVPGPLKRLGDAKVSNLQFLFGGEEDVGRLEIPVEDVPAVDVAEARPHLLEPVHDVCFSQMSSLLLDEASQVASITELHHDEELALLVEVVHVLDHVLMVTASEDLYLVPAQLLVPLAPAPHADLLHDAHAASGPGLHLPRLPERTLPNDLNLPVLVIES